ncbi:MAG: AraC family transcriptional regulator [Lachnospiraceae bacterium]
MEGNLKNSYKALEKNLMSLSVCNVGNQKCEPLYQWGPGVRDHYLIHHITAGKGFYTCADKTYELHAGDSFLVYPNTEITYCADRNDPWEYVWVGFSGSDAPSILKATDFRKNSPVIINNPMSDAIERQIHHIFEARGNEFEHAVEMTGRLYTTLALFMKSASRQEQKNSYATYAGKAVEYISARYSYPITIEDIADYIGISRSHLFRSFEKTIGKSPKEYLTEYRIRQACILLKKSDLSITAIANSVGFDNSLYFSKAFHKAKGMAPRDYAKSHRTLKSL